MAELNPPWALQNVGATHPSDLFRGLLQSLRGQAGVIAAGDLAVSQNGTPNMSVNVAAGKAVVDGTQNLVTQGSYLVRNDATVNKAIAASDPTNPRWDLVVAQVQDAFYSGAVNAWQIAVITGTPAPSPADPVVPANSLVLARVVVAANATTIVNANITTLAATGIILSTATPAVLAAAAVTGTSPRAAHADHQHQGVLRVRSSQSPGAIAGIVAGTWSNAGATFNITTTVASLIILLMTFAGAASVSTAVRGRCTYGGAQGDAGGAGADARHDALGRCGLTYIDTFQQGAGGTTTIQAQITMDNAGTFTFGDSQLQMLALAIPLV